MTNKILDDLIACGVPSDTLLAVAKLIADAELTEQRRERNREHMRVVRSRAPTPQHTETQAPTSTSENRINKKNQRSRQQFADDVADSDDPPPFPLSSPPTPPPIIPQPTPISESFAFGEPTQAELERELFRRGKQVCGKASGGLIASLLKSRQHDVALARSVLELAATKHDPREFVAASTRSKTNGNHFGIGSEIRGSDAGNRARELAELARQREREAGIFGPADSLRGD